MGARWEPDKGRGRTPELPLHQRRSRTGVGDSVHPPTPQVGWTLPELVIRATYFAVRIL